jgi:hypothetical protein
MMRSNNQKQAKWQVLPIRAFCFCKLCFTLFCSKMKINGGYLFFTILLFVVEVLIALFVADDFIRPYFGNTLVVILIYCFLQSFVRLPYRATTVAVFLFACFIEWLQYRQAITWLGWQHNALARTVLGTSFAWEDIWAYAAGAIIILLVEWYRSSKNTDAAAKR